MGYKENTDHILYHIGTDLAGLYLYRGFCGKRCTQGQHCCRSAYRRNHGRYRRDAPHWCLSLLTETVLADAYSGELSLNEYVIFISNSALAREYGLSFPQEIDWDKVCTGIKNKLEKISVMYNESERHQIVKSNIERYTNDENRAYDLIKSFRNNEGLMYKKNAQYYINEMKQNPSEVFRKCQNKRLNYFDHAMALATVRGFESLKNSEKAFFPGIFSGLLGGYNTFI